LLLIVLRIDLTFYFILYFHLQGFGILGGYFAGGHAGDLMIG
jgi:hypothetical protein